MYKVLIGFLFFVIGCSHSSEISERIPAATGGGSGGISSGETGLPRNLCVFHISGIEDLRVQRFVAKKMEKNGYVWNQENSLLNLVVTSVGVTDKGSASSTPASNHDYFKSVENARVKLRLQHGISDVQVYAIAAGESKAGAFPTTLSDALENAIEKISNCPTIFR